MARSLQSLMGWKTRTNESGYVHQPYPKWVTLADGSRELVENAEEEEVLTAPAEEEEVLTAPAEEEKTDGDDGKADTTKKNTKKSDTDDTGGDLA